MTTAADACWADPLSRKERTELAGRLSDYCTRFYAAGSLPPGTYLPSLVRAAREMCDLHRDVTAPETSAPRAGKE